MSMLTISPTIEVHVEPSLPTGSGAPTISWNMSRSWGIRILLFVLATCAAYLGRGTPTAHAEGFAPVHSFTGFSEPRGVAVEAATGDVFVLNSGTQRVLKLDPEGTVLGEFNGGETPQKEFATGAFGATGVAVDNSNSSSKGDVYVVAGENVVDKFKPKAGEPNSYEYTCQLTGPGGGCVREDGTPTETFGHPLGVAVDDSGNVYVAQLGFPGELAVYEFDSEGNDLASSPLYNEEHLTGPRNVAVDANGNIYVADYKFSPENVVEFNSGGMFQKELDEHGSTAVTVNPASGEVFVVDSEPEYHVTRYSATGDEIEQFGSGEIGESEGIAYSPFNGNVYVTDLAHNEVHVFERQTFKLPMVQVGSPEEPKPGNVVLKGSVNPEGEEGTNWYFAWGETEAYGSKTPVESVPKETSPVSVTAPLSGLAPNTIYHYRLFAYNTHDQTKPVGSGDQELTTTAIPPVVVDEPASFVATKAATLVAKVDPEHSTTKFHFEYGASESYGHETPEGSAGSGLVSGFVSQRVEGLTPGVTYYFRVVATNEQGMTERGADETFTTGGEAPPEAATGAVSDVTQSGAVVSGAVNPEGYATSYALELGTEPGSYDTQIYGTVGVGVEAVPVSVTLTNLAPLTTYQYRLSATNANGMSHGQDRTFTTPGTTYSLTLPPTVPLIAVPSIAFPTGSQENTSTTKTKQLTRAQKLAKALKACRKKSKGKRARCEKRVRKQYAPAKAGARQKKQ